MKQHTQKKAPNYKRTIISIVVISAITGGLVLLENYRAEQEVSEFAEQLSEYQVPVKSYDELTEQTTYLKNSADDSLSTTDANKLAEIAEQNLVSEEKQSTPELTPASNKTVLSDLDKASPSTHTDNKATSNQEALNVLFGLSSSVITPEYKLALTQIASHIKSKNQDIKWQVVGHTDKSGHALYNLQLAKKRAQNVALFLVEQGINEDQLKLITFGEYEATKLEHSTYNKGLRRVQISEYKPEITTLAAKLEKRYEKIELQRVHKEQLARASKKKLSDKVDVSEQEQTVKFTPDSEKNKKTSVALEPLTEVKTSQQPSDHLDVTLLGKPLVDNPTQQLTVAENYSL